VVGARRAPPPPRRLRHDVRKLLALEKVVPECELDGHAVILVPERKLAVQAMSEGQSLGRGSDGVVPVVAPRLKARRDGYDRNQDEHERDAVADDAREVDDVVTPKANGEAVRPVFKEL
jgi:hypothetical protein